MAIIYHMTTKGAWAAVDPSQGYQPESLATEGFIHCSTITQLLGVANGLYRGQQESIILFVEESRVAAKIIYEDCYETKQDFPHIYGPLMPSAVTEIIEFPCNEDGSFDLPVGLGSSA